MAIEENVLQAASRMYPEVIFDSALPQEWVDQMVTAGYDPRGQFVWGYPYGNLYGMPLPLSTDALKWLLRTAAVL